jgi:hypothetical protein
MPPGVATHRDVRPERTTHTVTRGVCAPTGRALGRGRPHRGGPPAAHRGHRRGQVRAEDHVGVSTLARRPDSPTAVPPASGTGPAPGPCEAPIRGEVLAAHNVPSSPKETPLRRGVWTATASTRDLTYQLSGQIQATNGLGCLLVQRASDRSIHRSPGHEEPNEPRVRCRTAPGRAKPDVARRQGRAGAGPRSAAAIAKLLTSPPSDRCQKAVGSCQRPDGQLDVHGERARRTCTLTKPSRRAQ